ncbi:MAG: hypothetical protein IJJ42_03950 [Clostridia bacterium]|nr:hypothetical protein [Clostridia bacterium]
MRWNKKTVIGLIMVILGVLLAVFVIQSIDANIPHTGRWAGKITQYRQPFYGHGIMVIWLFLLAAILFLTGLVLFFIGKND